MQRTFLLLLRLKYIKSKGLIEGYTRKTQTEREKFLNNKIIQGAYIQFVDRKQIRAYFIIYFFSSCGYIFYNGMSAGRYET